MVGVRPGEEVMVGLVVALMFVAWAGLALGQSSIDALLFARFGVELLPLLYVLLGVLSAVASLVVTGLLQRTPPRSLYVTIPLVLATLLVIGRFAVSSGTAAVYGALWLLAGVALLVQGFYLWGIAGLVTDTRQAKRLFPLFAAGGIAGAAMGGLVTGSLAAWLGAENLLLVWAVSLVAVTALARRLMARHAAPIAAMSRHGWRPLRAIRQGWQVMSGSTMLRWLAVAALLFSVLLYLLYLPFSAAAAERFPDAGRLAGFLGTFTGVATVMALLVSVLGAPRLFAGWGAPSVVVAYGVVYVAGFALLVFDSSFISLAAVRFVQLIAMQGLANSAWETMINVTPPERRDQARAFINGLPAQAGTALAGVMLLAGEERLGPSVLFAVGLSLALAAAFASWRAKRGYPGAVVETLRAGRPHVFDGSPLALVDAAAIDAVLSAVTDHNPRVRRIAVEMLDRLPESSQGEALRLALSDADAEVREAALRSIVTIGETVVLPNVAVLLADPQPDVRLAATDAIGELGGEASMLLGLIGDPDPTVRAQAASWVSGAHPGVLDSVLAPMSIDPDDRMRAIAVAAMGRAVDNVCYRLVADRHDDPSPTVRTAAARAMVEIDPERSLPTLIDMLGDGDPGVLSEVAVAIGRVGVTALAATAEALDRPETESGALLALKELPRRGVTGRIRWYAERQVAHSKEDAGLAAAIVADGDERWILIRDSLRGLSLREAGNAVRAAALLVDDSPLKEALDNLNSDDPAQRAGALELIDSSHEAALLHPLVSVLEGTEVEEGPLPIPKLLHHHDRWIRRCAEFATTPGDEMARTLPTLSVMERVLNLRKVPLFAHLAPHELERIAEVAEEEAHGDGDMINVEGEPGTDMHIVISGSVVVTHDGVEVARRGEGEVVGEMAVIADQPRMASLVADGDVRLLTIGRGQFTAILRERPDTALAVMRVLVQRLVERDSRL
jgi:HEAT repeat protein